MLTKLEVVAPLAAARRDEVVVTTMGAVRAWGRVSDHPLDFASVDSAMGHAADFALGIALAQPARRVICLNGDGSMLMSLGTLATVVQSEARNLILIVLQNGSYEITGNQAVPGGRALDFARIAEGSGFTRAWSVSDPGEWDAMVPGLLRDDGPVLVALQVEPGTDGPMRRGPSEGLTYLVPSLAESTRALRRVLAPANG